MIAAVCLLAGVLPLAPLPVHPSAVPVRQLQARHLTGEWDFTWSRLHGHAWLNADASWRHRCGVSDYRGVWSLRNNGILDIVEYRCERGKPVGEPLAYRLTFQADEDGCYDPVRLSGWGVCMDYEWRYNFAMSKPARKK